MKGIFSYHVELIHLPVRDSVNCSIPLLNQHDNLKHSMTTGLQITAQQEQIYIELVEATFPIFKTDIIHKPAV